MSSGEWDVVVPVKGTALAKSRLAVDADRRTALATAIALDTLAAVTTAGRVRSVIVVTGRDWAEHCTRLPVRVVVEQPGGGLLAAIRAGLETVAPGRPTAVLLGDLPALRASELDAALDAAALHDRAFVPDAEGTGTVLITARSGVSHLPAFGPDSSARHALAGYTRLEVPGESGLRRDVDTLDSLALLGTRVGAHTRSALG